MAKKVLVLCAVHVAFAIFASSVMAQEDGGCLPDCSGKECGDDGCGGECGTCEEGLECNVAGICEAPCQPDCSGKECGDDGCGGDCGTCEEGLECTVAGICEAPCLPECMGKECGDDGCGGSCGTCDEGQQCADYLCVDVCVPDCEGKECGDDGCGGDCGQCDEALECFDGLCGPTPGECGDGFCHYGLGEQCENCAADCDCPTNYACQPGGVCVIEPLYDPGCAVHTTPACDQCPCEACVCQLDPYCCTVKWDARCVEECVECGTLCVPPGICGNMVCEPGHNEDCDSCPVDCGCIDGLICDEGECVEDLPESKGCQINYSPGCGGCDCESCVCNMDYYCCMYSWDSYCVQLCKECGGNCKGGSGGAQCGNWWCQPELGENCGNCSTDCYCNYFEQCIEEECVINGTNEGCWETYEPGCDNCACEECVCSIYPSCCEKGSDYYGGWDWNCVYTCQEQCGGCGPPQVCGDEKCVSGENCATCPEDCACKEDSVCYLSSCCKPQCNGKQCGPDGCGGSCGTCEVGVCDSGKCATGLGCDEHQGPGCLNCACQACVCELAPKCCTDNWDAACVSYCALDCGGCEKIPWCGDGICAPALGENCASCAADCGCTGFEYCKASVCTVDYCRLELGEAGCCADDSLFLCIDGEITQVDCAAKGWICGWYAGSETLGSRYYCGPEGQVDPLGDPSGENPPTCPGCLPQCGDLQCGSDGCGGLCGLCPAGEVCIDGYCEPCTPDCTDLECGHDGCGGSCGLCPVGDICDDGQCLTVCIPNCTGRNCGPDGCGGSCGDCLGGMECLNGKCTVCVPKCDDKECGSDGCGGSCGFCFGDLVCEEGKCVIKTCKPQCAGAQCGDDGCGGSCGTCEAGLECNPQKQCVEPCVPDCLGRFCGDDGCGGSCGGCSEGLTCKNGKCTGPCTPYCEGRQCGDDGCGGRCGSCPETAYCNPNGICVEYNIDLTQQDTSDAAPQPDTAPDGDKTGLRGGSCAASAQSANGPTAGLALLSLLGLLMLALRRRPKDLPSGYDRR